MGLFSYIQRIKFNTIYIPENIRAYFGWKEGLHLYISSLKPTDISENLANELILTTVSPKNRLDLWRLQVSFRDRKGLIKELTELLKDHSIDIVSCKVSTVDQNRFLNVEFEIDVQLYENEFDKDSATRKVSKYVYLDELKNLIVARFIEDIIFVPSQDLLPMAKIKRNLPLYRSYVNLDNLDETTINSGAVRVPDTFIEEIRETFLSKYPNIKENKGANSLPLASVVADLESYLVRIFIFFPNTGYLHLRIRSKNRVGAISEISKVLNECEININQMFNRPIEDGRYSLTDFLVHHTNYNCPIDDKSLRALVTKRFTRHPLKDVFEFYVTYPNLINY